MQNLFGLFLVPYPFVMNKDLVPIKENYSLIWAKNQNFSILFLKALYDL